MAYCFMRFEKVKSMSNFAHKMEHNYRTKPVLHADSKRTENNREIVKMVTENYATEYKRLIDKYKCNPRKDAVKGLEFIMSFNSKEIDHEIDIKKWEDANVNWLKKTFGDENVISAISHHDEGPNGAVHIHAMVIPMVNGRLCAKELVNGSAKLSAMQTSYANDMKQFGLERGIEGSTMEHKDLARWHNATKRDTDISDMLPTPHHGERIRDYYERAEDAFYTHNAKQVEKIRKLEQKITEMEARHKNELIGDRSWYTNRIDILQIEKEREIEKNNKLKKAKKELEEKIEKNSKDITEYTALKKAINNIPDEERRKQVQNNIDGLIDWQIKEDRKNER